MSAAAATTTAPGSLNGGDIILKVLAQYEIEYIFTSPIAALAPLWEAFAKRDARSATPDGGGQLPKYINCRHESLAIGLAIGYYKSTGKVAAVCLPTGLGVLNGSMALRTARQERIPMLVISPDTRTYGEDPSVDAGPEWPTFLIDDHGPAQHAQRVSKWSIACHTKSDLVPNLHRALYFSRQIPTGPTCVEIPFEVLMASFDEQKDMVERFPTAIASDQSHVVASDDHIRLVTDVIGKAKNPIIITEHFGQDKEAVDALTKLAEAIAAPVYEWWIPSYKNINRTHPLHGKGAVEDILPDVDVVIVTCAHGPWHGPLQAMSSQDTKVIVLEQDPMRPNSAYWGYRTTHCVAGDPVANTRRILHHLLESQESELSLLVPGRLERWTEYNISKRDAFHKQCLEEQAALAKEGGGRIYSMDFFTALSASLPSDAIIVDEMVAQMPYFTRFLFQDPEKQFQHIRGWQGGLGTGLSVALGAKLANPSKTVVCILGDGAFNYNPIPAVFGLAQQRNVPILICVMNNNGYVSQRWNMYKYFPGGTALKTDKTYGDVIAPNPDYEKIPLAWGGLGSRVEDANTLASTLETALASDQMYLLNVSVTP